MSMTEMDTTPKSTSPSPLKYRRILLKISGEALMGDQPARRAEWLEQVQSYVAEYWAECEPLRNSDAMPLRPERMTTFALWACGTSTTIPRARRPWMPPTTGIRRSLPARRRRSS